MYFISRNNTKEGPLSIEQLKDLKLTEDTLVWKEGMSNWSKISEIEELNGYYIKKPPSLPGENEQQDEVIISETDDLPKKIKIPLFVIALGLIILFVTLSYVVVKKQSANDLLLIQQKIEQVFNGKDKICDYKKYAVKGELREPGDYLTPYDDNGNKLIEYFECTNGGFSVLTLTKKPNGFEYTEKYSTNMGYKIAENRWVDLSKYGVESMSGFTVPTHRETIQEAYDGAMEYLTVEKPDKSYVAGAFDKISAFDEIRTQYHYIDNIKPTIYSPQTIDTKSWSSTSDQSVYNNQWIIWYAEKGKHYEIVENAKAINYKWYIYSSICIISILSLYLIFRYRQKIQIKLT